MDKNFSDSRYTNKMRNDVFAGAVIIMVIGAVLYSLPFVLYGQHPLGYDTGFYRKFLIQTSWFDPVPGLGSDALMPRIFLGFIRATSIPTDIALYGSYIVLQMFGAVALFLFLRLYFVDAIAFIAGMMFLLSSVQYTAYWYMLFKSAFALPLLLISFLLIETQSPYAIVASVILSLSHQTTTIIYLCTLAVFLVFNRKQWRQILPIFVIVLGIFAYLHYPKLYGIQHHLPSAMFLDWGEYLAFSLPLFLLVPFGIGRSWQHKKSVFAAFGIATLLFPLLSLPFYQRIFIFVDIFFISIASASIYYLYHRALQSTRKNQIISIIIVMSIFGGWYMGNFFNIIRSLRPLTNHELIKELESLSSFVPENSTILTESEIAPWVNGFTHNDVIAPGLLGDYHNYEQWQEFWRATTTSQKIKFLNDSKKPLYLFIDPQAADAFLPKAGCVVPHSSFIYEYRC